MKLKTLIVTVAILAVLSAIAFFVQRPAPPPSADPRLGQALVERATAEKAAKLQLSDQGKTVTLVRQADGSWRVPGYYDFPADFSKLSSFVGSLTDAKLQRLVTSNPERIARLEFKATKIEFLDAADKSLWSVTLGKTPENGSGRYVRFGAEPKAFLSDLNAWLEVEPKNWVNTELLTVKPDEVAKIEVPFAEGGGLTISRPKKDDAWAADKTPAGQRVKADKVSALVSSFNNVRFTDTANLDDPNVTAAKANARTFKLTTLDGKIITVALGQKPEEKKLKPLNPATDAKSGPPPPGSASDLPKPENKSPEEAVAQSDAPKPTPPEFETIPAGPVFIFITHSDTAAPVNALMQKRAFQISDYAFTGLPQKAEDLFEAASASAPAPGTTPAAIPTNPGTPAAGK